MHDRGEMPTPDPGWLRHVAEGGHRPDAALPEPRKWETADLGEPPTRDGTDAGRRPDPDD